MNRALTCTLATLLWIFAPAQAGAELPDPTRPADFFDAEPIAIQELPQRLVDFKLSAVRISGEDRTAIVNGHLVRVGEKIGTAELVSIEADSVVLDYEDRRLIVPLYTQRVIKTLRN